MTIPRLLIVDDDDEMRAMLTRWLQAHGFAVAAAADGAQARAAVEGRRIDLILLDVMLGDESGIDICRRLRAESEVPVIIVSALASDDHRMAGYRVGADDYIAKPFNPDLLVERVRAVLRRGRRASSLTYRRRAARYRFAGCLFDAAGEDMIGADGVQIGLSTRERRLLSVLLANPLIPLTREEIAQALDPDRDAGQALEAAEGRAIDVLVARLRAKLEPDPRTPRIIRTERGTGYVLAVPVTVEEG
jgi:two-component system OmpR family response regulator